MEREMSKNTKKMRTILKNVIKHTKGNRTREHQKNCGWCHFFFSGYSFTCLEADRAQRSFTKITQSNDMPYVNVDILCFDDQMRVSIELIKWLGNYRAIIHGQMPWIRKVELLIFFLSWCEYQPHSKHWQHCFSEARFPWESLNSFHSILFKFQFLSMVVIIWKQFAWNPFSRIAENLKTPVTRHGWCEDRKNSVRNFALVRKK